jgi:hypothetical protein
MITDAMVKAAAEVLADRVPEAEREGLAREMLQKAEAASWPIHQLQPQYRVMHFPHRRRRAETLTAHVLDLLRRQISRERHAAEDAYRILMDAFYTAGVEIVSDADRAAAGLRPRDESGLTIEELTILEHRRIEAMLRPVMFTVPKDQVPPGLGG